MILPRFDGALNDSAARGLAQTGASALILMAEVTACRSD
jgi:hypothetical protein